MASERRSEPRDDRLSAVVWIREQGVTTATVVRNASRRGLCIDHLRDRQPGQTFDVQVMDHDLNLSFECQAVVRWSQAEPSPRTGVELVACSSAWEQWVSARWGRL